MMGPTGMVKHMIPILPIHPILLPIVSERVEANNASTLRTASYYMGEREPSMRTIVLWLMLAGAALGGGCYRAEVTGMSRTSPSLQRELDDLKKARDTGAITPGEYEQLRQKISAAPKQGQQP